MDLGDAVLTLTTDDSDLKGGLDKASQEAQKRGKEIAQNIGVAVAAFVAFSRELYNAWAQAELAGKKLEAAFKATGQESSVATARIKALADQLQATTMFEGDATVAASAMLVTVGNLTENGIAKALPVIADFAAGMGMDMEQASALFSKAVSGNMGMLGRYGIHVKDTGDAQKNFNLLIGTLSDKFHGMAVEMGNTASGAMVKFKNALDDIKESAGRVLAEALTPLLNIFTPLLNKISGFIMETMDFATAQRAVINHTASLSQQLLVARTGVVDLTAQLRELTAKMNQYNEEVGKGAIKTVAQVREFIAWDQEAQRLKHNIGALNNVIKDVTTQQQALSASTDVNTTVTTVATDEQKAYAAALAAANDGVAGGVTRNVAANRVYTDQIGIMQKVNGMMKQRKDLWILEKPEIEKVTAATQTWGELAYNWLVAENDMLLELSANQKKSYDVMLSLAQTVFSQLTSISSVYYQSQMTDLDNWYAAQLLALGDMTNATDEQLKAKLRLDVEYAEKLKILKQQEWSANQALAVSSAIMSTAQAVATSLASLAWPWNLIPAGIVAALGAVQVGLILNEPMPAFAQGADFVVPPGYPDDSFQMRVTSGEHVSVTPAGQDGGEPIRVIVNLDSRPILDAVTRGSRNRQVFITARSVVP